MKNNFKLALLFLTLIFAFSSCKDEVKPEPKKEFVYGGSTYPVTSSFLTQDGKNDTLNTYDFELWLLTNTLSVNIADTAFVGKGGFLVLNFNTNTPFFLASGTYNLLDDELSPEYGLQYGSVVLDVEAADLNSTEADRPYDLDGFTSGTVVVVRNNNEYTLTVEGVTESGLTIKADYTGTPTKYDFR